MNPDTTGLHFISHGGGPESEADIVFVHGLGGGSHSTWRHGREGEAGHFFWPEELGKDLPDCAVWSLGYEAGVVPWFGVDGLPIEDRAKNLAHKLTTGGLGRRPLIFIAHSMGGLMVKEIVVQALTAGDVRWSGLVQQVAGIVFCGTPHRGSEVAQTVQRLAVLLQTPDYIGEMATGQRHLDQLHRQFVEWHRKTGVRVEAYAEGIGMKRHHWLGRLGPKIMVVPPTSADPQLPACRCIPCHDDHVELVKPRNRQHDVYAGVLRFSREIVEGLSGGDRVLEPVEAEDISRPKIRELIREILREEGYLRGKQKD